MENQSEKLDHQVAGLPSLRLASSRIQFSVHTGHSRHHRRHRICHAGVGAEFFQRPDLIATPKKP